MMKMRMDYDEVAEALEQEIDSLSQENERLYAEIDELKRENDDLRDYISRLENVK